MSPRSRVYLYTYWLIGDVNSRYSSSIFQQLIQMRNMKSPHPTPTPPHPPHLTTHNSALEGTDMEPADVNSGNA